MAQPIGLEDRGAYWIVSYDDGGFDNVPKDPNVIDTAAVNADAIGQKETAAKLRMWAQNIRQTGKPVVISSGFGTIALLVAAIFGGGWLLSRGLR